MDKDQPPDDAAPTCPEGSTPSSDPYWPPPDMRDISTPLSAHQRSLIARQVAAREPAAWVPPAPQTWRQ